MACISVSGTGFAAPTRGLAALGLFVALLGAAPLASLDVGIDGLRSAKGELLVCLTTEPEHFPDCQDDPAARRLTVATQRAGTLHFNGLPSGTYALAMIHDENGNDRLDTFAGIPREGVGFSRNPRLTFGPPRFKAAGFPVMTGNSEERIRVKYFL